METLKNEKVKLFGKTTTIGELNKVFNFPLHEIHDKESYQERLLFIDNVAHHIGADSIEKLIEYYGPDQDWNYFFEFWDKTGDYKPDTKTVEVRAFTGPNDAINSYNVSDSNWPVRVRAMYVNNKNLNTIHCQLSKLKTQMLKRNVIHPDYAAQIAALRNKFPNEQKRIDEFNALTTYEKNRAAIDMRKNDDELSQAMSKLSIVPANLQRLALAPKEQIARKKAQLAAQRRKDGVDKKGDIELIQSIGSKVKDVKEVQVINGNDMISRLQALESADWQQCAVGLMLATGRRTVEILKTAVFEPTTNPHIVTFMGQTKALGERKYEIPCLAPSWLIIKALKRVRDECRVTNMTNEQVQDVYGAQMRIKAVKHARFHPHELRAIYAMLSWQLYGQKENITQFTARILGDDITSAVRYQRWVVDNITGTYQPLMREEFEQKEIKQIQEIKQEIKQEKKQIKWDDDSSRFAYRFSEAADELVAEGKLITQNAIYNKRGGKADTIKKWLAANKDNVEWWNSEGKRV